MRGNGGRSGETLVLCRRIGLVLHFVARLRQEARRRDFNLVAQSWLRIRGRRCNLLSGPDSRRRYSRRGRNNSRGDRQSEAAPPLPAP
jgi:hypothetical protein